MVIHYNIGKTKSNDKNQGKIEFLKFLHPNYKVVRKLILTEIIEHSGMQLSVSGKFEK